MKQLFPTILFVIALLMCNVVYAEPSKSDKRQVVFKEVEKNKDNKGNVFVPFSLTIHPSGYLNGTTLYIEFNTAASLAEVIIYQDEAVVDHGVVTIMNAEDGAIYDLGQYGRGEYQVVIEFSDGSEYEAWLTV